VTCSHVVVRSTFSENVFDGDQDTTGCVFWAFFLGH